MNPTTTQRRRQTILSFDIQAMCFGMVRLCASRIQTSLRDVEERKQRGEDYEDALDAAFLDAWSIVDACHRIRCIIASTPGIKQHEPWLEVFLRSTKPMEDLRHYVQHLNSRIPKLPSQWTPMMGTLSWVSFTDDQTCLVTMLGSLEDRITNHSIAYDTVNRCFASQIELTAGDHCVSILDVAAKIQRLKEDIIAWIGQQEGWETATRKTPIYTMRLIAATLNDA